MVFYGVTSVARVQSYNPIKSVNINQLLNDSLAKIRQNKTNPYISLRWRHNDHAGVSNTSLTVVYSIVYSGVNQRKHQSSASLAFVREIHRGPVNFPHKWPVTRKMFPFDDVIMIFMGYTIHVLRYEFRWRLLLHLLLANDYHDLWHIFPENSLMITTVLHAVVMKSDKHITSFWPRIVQVTKIQLWVALYVSTNNFQLHQQNEQYQWWKFLISSY